MDVTSLFLAFGIVKCMKYTDVLYIYFQTVFRGTPIFSEELAVVPHMFFPEFLISWALKMPL
jgi:hypothetical protein